jgi:GLPGLI family protein
MKNKIFIFLIFLISCLHVAAQHFISKAAIEYEVKSNIKKNMGNGAFEDLLTDKLPEFKIGYYNLTFADGKSVYKFDHWSDGPKLPNFLTSSDESDVWYFNYNSEKYDIEKNIFGSEINIADSISNLKWRITNETRVIAGFSCRKAFTTIFDSVYVFAFYTDEIMLSGGPCSIHGLPGLILGMTIPRLYTSWIATKVMVNNIDEKIIKPVEAKKTYKLDYLNATFKDRTKDWYSDDETENKEIKEQKARYLWNMML